QQLLRELSPLLRRQVGPGQSVRLAEDHGPGEEEDDLHVEDHEQEGHDVEAKIKLDPGTADGRLAAFIDRLLFRVGPGRSNKLAGEQVDEDKADADDEKQQQVRHQTVHEATFMLGDYFATFSASTPGASAAPQNQLPARASNRSPARRAASRGRLRGFPS